MILRSRRAKASPIRTPTKTATAAWHRPNAFRVRATYAPASSVHKFRGQDSVALAMFVAAIG
jgi:hypothetical protein